MSKFPFPSGTWISDQAVKDVQQEEALECVMKAADRFAVVAEMLGRFPELAYDVSSYLLLMALQAGCDYDTIKAFDALELIDAINERDDDE